MALGFGALDSSQKAPFRVSGFHKNPSFKVLRVEFL